MKTTGTGIEIRNRATALVFLRATLRQVGYPNVADGLPEEVYVHKDDSAQWEFIGWDGKTRYWIFIVQRDGHVGVAETGQLFPLQNARAAYWYLQIVVRPDKRMYWYRPPTDRSRSGYPAWMFERVLEQETGTWWSFLVEANGKIREYAHRYSPT